MRSPFRCWPPRSGSVTRSCWCSNDVHAITAEKSYTVLAFLVDHVPPGCQLVLVTRGDPGVPLGRLRAGGDLVEIGTALLALDAKETRDVAASVGLELSQEASGALCERTEGWAAAVVLAATFPARP